MWKSIQSAPEKKNRVWTNSGIRPARPDLSFFPFRNCYYVYSLPLSVLARKKEGMRETMQK